MGSTVGISVGDKLNVGFRVGPIVGDSLGERVWFTNVGDCDGFIVVGITLGATVVGAKEGILEGARVGFTEGVFDGFAVGVPLVEATVG